MSHRRVGNHRLFKHSLPSKSDILAMAGCVPRRAFAPCLRLFLLAISAVLIHAGEINLVKNPDFDGDAADAKTPDHYELEGAAAVGRMGGRDEFTTQGIIFPGNAQDGGSVAQLVHGIDPAKGAWLTFRFRGLPEEGFAVTGDALIMKIEFFAKDGAQPRDAGSRAIYREIEKDRAKLSINGNFHQAGAAVWRSYEFEELIPFPDVDSVKISVAYRHGSAASAKNSSFFLDDFSLVQRAASQTGRVVPTDTRTSTVPARTGPVDESKLVALGGRWYYLPAEGETITADTKVKVTEANSERLFYKSDRFINPFANNMSAWMRAGYKDQNGEVLTRDRFLPENVVLNFNRDGYLTVHAHNIPNHPAAKFPDDSGSQGYNPSYIQDLNKTYRLPLDPVLNPEAKAMDAKNRNGALGMGAIGVAVNGVVFYNPFDAGMNDASSIMDRCCGHPSPDNRYHYHKYPVCVNTPFVDKGDGHSQLVGFAFDGLPIYGPYEKEDEMASESTDNPLNAFNAHEDPVRGWHYHVTPGKFPYIIGGYLAKTEASNFERRPMTPPGGQGMPMMAPPGGGSEGRPGGPGGMGRPPGRPGMGGPGGMRGLGVPRGPGGPGGMGGPGEGPGGSMPGGPPPGNPGGDQMEDQPGPGAGQRPPPSEYDFFFPPPGAPPLPPDWKGPPPGRAPGQGGPPPPPPDGPPPASQDGPPPLPPGEGPPQG